jgi:hypothetical protein
MEIDLNKQMVPYIEHVINQTLDMVERICVDTDNINRMEISRLLTQLEEDFGSYLTLLSPQTQGRLMEINRNILKDNEVYEELNDQQDTPLFDDNTKE